MSKFIDELNRRILVIDGAMGTQLMDRGVSPSDCFDAQNLKNPHLVEAVHKAYVEAGADIIETNTFGANSLKLAEYGLENKVEEINIQAAKIARSAIKDKGFVCGSIGPLGSLIDPLGDVTFDQAYAAFSQQAKALEQGGVDVICVETISDLQEMRAAAIAVKNETKLPLICSLTFDPGEKTIYGTSPEVAVVVLESLGVDIIGSNCSTGPQNMLKVAKKLLACSNKPIMMMPNAGMPELIKGKAIYKMTPKQFGQFAVKFAQIGVSIIGGCCGTDPRHIQEVKKQITNNKQQTIPKQQIPKCLFASRTRVVEMSGNRPLLIGERINPTARKLFQEEIKLGKMQIIRQEAQTQTKQGADLLDVNVSVADTKESENMHKAVVMVQSASDLALSIDSPNYSAMQIGLKSYCGRALLNSVNGKKESLENVLPIARKYGAAIIALCLDEKGIPQNAAQRLSVAEKIVNYATSIGIARQDIFVDNLVMTAGIGIDACLETLKAIPLVKEKLGVNTVLGISNVSHGLPNRSKINALYFQLAVAYGLDAGIVDVTDGEMKKALEGLPAGRQGMRGQKKGKKAQGKEGLLKAFKAEVEKARRSGKPAEKKKEAVIKNIKIDGYESIKDAVIEGNVDLVLALVNKALDKKMDAQKIINKALVPGMEIVGKRFTKKEYFLPQVIESAEAMKRGFEVCKARIPKDKVKVAGRVLLATVEGDIHDIGKNIVRMLLENHGFIVIDLGKDVAADQILAIAKKEKPQVIALSALLTTTMTQMELVKQGLKKAKLNIPLLVGGAVVTKGYAEKIGASYSVDAVGAVALAKKIIYNMRGQRWKK